MKFTKKHSFLIALVVLNFLSIQSAQAQGNAKTDDYRAIKSGSWYTLAIWEKCNTENGSCSWIAGKGKDGWSVATEVPSTGKTNAETRIQGESTVTIDTAVSCSKLRIYGTLNINVGQILTINGGDFNIQGTPGKTHNWQGTVVLGGNGITIGGKGHTVNNTGTVTQSGNNFNVGSTFNNNEGGTLKKADGNFNVYAGGTFNNNTGGTIIKESGYLTVGRKANPDATPPQEAAPGIFNNSGTFDNNGGNINVYSTSTFNCAAGSTFKNDATMAVLASGAILTFAGTYKGTGTFTGTTFVNTGTVEQPASLTFSSGFTNFGKVNGDKKAATTAQPAPASPAKAVANVPTASGAASKKGQNNAVTIGKIKFPYTFKYEGNPLSRMHGAADPDAQVYDGEVWVYCSQDRLMDSTKHKAHYDAMDGYHAFSSKDMINWTDHGEILHSSDVSWANGGYLWAPGSARKNGKYYLYYPLKDKNLQWKIGVAIGDKPAGPFTDTGKPIEGIGGIDPKIFIDDDGTAYIYNNSAIVAKLKPNMIELAEPTRKVIYGSPEVMKEDSTRFSEGSYMHKRNGVYYYSYTCLKNKNHHAMYAMGSNPYGPFEFKGPLAPRPQGAQDHHSIIEFKGEWYYFYHISLKDLPKYKESQGRIVCFDKLFYNADGTIQMIKHTR